MNNIQSSPEWYRGRWLAGPLRHAVHDHPVVVLTGARQTGKTTLLREEDPFRTWHYVTLDDLDARAAARDDPVSLWAGHESVVIDEVQRVPDLLLGVKQAIDHEPDRRFVLSGSANLRLMEGIGDTLAGRAVYLTLRPFTEGEIHALPPASIIADLLASSTAQEAVLHQYTGARPTARLEASGSGDLPTVSEPPAALLLRGFMPRLLQLPDTGSRLRWWEGYVSTYLERDLRQIRNVSSLIDFRQIMQLAALRTGGLLNESDIARDASVSQPTAHRYIGLLEVGHLLAKVGPFLGNRSQRLVKSPKVHWHLPGLATFLAGLHDEPVLSGSRELGGLFETLVYHHLRTHADLLLPKANVLHWRTRGHREVDFVLERGRSLVACEVKTKPRVGYRDTEGLRAFCELHNACGLLIHPGSACQMVATRILAVPWQVVAGDFVSAA